MPDEGPLPTANHVRVMDGMRGLAILLVVMYHYWQLSWWSLSMRMPDGSSQGLQYIQFSGALGVELFFFISAFCLTYPHAKAMFGQGAPPTLRHFYYRRFIKIVPSYVLALAVFGIGFAGLYSSHYEHGVLADFGVHLLFLHNLSPQTLSSFDGVMWSLAVEVQFYYVFPVLAWLFRRWPKTTVVAMTTVAICWRFYARSFGVDSSEQWGNQLPGFFDLFAFGMLAAYLIVWLRQRPEAMRKLRFLMTAMAVTAFVLMLAMFHWQTAQRWQQYAADSWKSQNRQYLAAIYLFIAVCSAYSIGLWRRVLANPILTFLSTISYNLYLWHQSVGVLIRDRHWWKSTTTPPMNDPHWRWTYLIVAVGASIGIATFITYVFERPLLKHGVFGVVARLTRGRVDFTASAGQVGDGSDGHGGVSGNAVAQASLTSAPSGQLLADRVSSYVKVIRRQPLLAGIAAFVATVVLSVFRSQTGATYVHLASSFNQGHVGIMGLDLADSINVLPFTGQHPGVNGPIPAVLSMPFAGVFGSSFSQMWLAAGLIGVIVAGVWTIGLQLHLETSNVVRGAVVATVLAEALWLMGDGDVVTVALLSAFAFTAMALAEWCGDRRWPLIVVWSLCACESQFSFYLVLAVFFAVLGWLERRTSHKHKGPAFVNDQSSPAVPTFSGSER